MAPHSVSAVFERANFNRRCVWKRRVVFAAMKVAEMYAPNSTDTGHVLQNIHPSLSVLHQSLQRLHSQSCPSSDVFYLMFGLPLALPPGMFLCIISFSRLSSFFLIVCPKDVSFLFLIDSGRCLSVSACSAPIHLFSSLSTRSSDINMISMTGL